MSIGAWTSDPPAPMDADRAAPHRAATHRDAPHRSGRNPPVRGATVPPQRNERAPNPRASASGGRRPGRGATQSGPSAPFGAQSSRSGRNSPAPTERTRPKPASQRHRRDDGDSTAGRRDEVGALRTVRGALLPSGRNSHAPTQRTRPKPESQRERRDDDATQSGPSAPFGAHSSRWGAPVTPQRNERAPNPRDGGLSGEIAEAAASRDAGGTVGYRKMSGNSRSSGVPGTAA